MKKWRGIFESSARRLYARLLLGGWESLAGLALFGLLVFAFLFATVHHRDLSRDWPKYGVAYGFERYPNLIRFWIEQGYFKHGGLWFPQIGDPLLFGTTVDPNTTLVAKNGNMGYLQVAHVLERINYIFRGTFSYTLMVLHNQAWVWLSSTLLGLLAMRLARRIEIKPLYALLFGVASTAIYQTFPINLWYYWEISVSAVGVVFILLFLLIEEYAYGREQTPHWFPFLRGLCVFMLIYADWFGGSFLLATYFLVAITLSSQSLKQMRPLKTVALPTGAALGIFALQIGWVRLNFPNAQWVGSGFMYRTGFDGSTRFYASHLDLITSRLLFDKFMPQWTLLPQSWFLFVAGGLSILILVGFYLTRLPQLRCAVIILALSLGYYLLMAFLFSQSAVIHPYIYDVYLVIPLILAFYAVLPASLEHLTKNSGFFAFAVMLMAFCYTMVQLRTYAMLFPLTTLP